MCRRRSCCNGTTAHGNTAPTGARTTLRGARTLPIAVAIWVSFQPPVSGCGSKCPPRRSGWKATRSTAWPLRCTAGARRGITPASQRRECPHQLRLLLRHRRRRARWCGLRTQCQWVPRRAATLRDGIGRVLTRRPTPARPHISPTSSAGCTSTSSTMRRVLSRSTPGISCLLISTSIRRTCRTR